MTIKEAQMVLKNGVTDSPAYPKAVAVALNCMGKTAKCQILRDERVPYEKVYYCTNCKHMTLDPSKFCRYCGAYNEDFEA